MIDRWNLILCTNDNKYKAIYMHIYKGWGVFFFLQPLEYVKFEENGKDG